MTQGQQSDSSYAMGSLFSPESSGVGGSTRERRIRNHPGSTVWAMLSQEHLSPSHLTEPLPWP